jgi:hypothetical protein
MVPVGINGSMAHHFEFDFDHKILRLVLEGNVEVEPFLRLNSEIRVQTERLRPLAGITDGAGIVNFNVPSQTLRTVAMQGSPYPATTPRYIVAPSDYLFGMARMYELIGNHSEGKLQVVRKMEEALADLGVTSAKFERVS